MSKCITFFEKSIDLELDKNLLISSFTRKISKLWIETKIVNSGLFYEEVKKEVSEIQTTVDEDGLRQNDSNVVKVKFERIYYV